MLNGEWFLNFVIDNSLTKTQIPYEVIVQTLFVIKHEYHPTVLMCRAVEGKKRKIVRDVTSSTLECMTAHHVQEARYAVIVSCLLGPLPAVI